MVSFIIPNGSFAYANVDNGGEFISQTLDLLIDDSDKAINLIFPY
jgi:hypothetical protein